MSEFLKMKWIEDEINRGAVKTVAFVAAVFVMFVGFFFVTTMLSFTINTISCERHGGMYGSLPKANTDHSTSVCQDKEGKNLPY